MSFCVSVTALAVFVIALSFPLRRFCNENESCPAQRSWPADGSQQRARAFWAELGRHTLGAPGEGRTAAGGIDDAQRLEASSSPQKRCENKKKKTSHIQTSHHTKKQEE